MYQKVILNSTTGKVEQMKTKEEMLLAIIEEQDKYIILKEEGREALDRAFPDDAPYISDYDDDSVIDGIKDNIQDMKIDFNISYEDR